MKNKNEQQIASIGKKCVQFLRILFIFPFTILPYRIQPVGRFILFINVVLFSCMGEEYDDCSELENGNLILNFEYPDLDDKKDGSDVFDERIYKLDVLLFDETLNIYRIVNIDTEQIARTRKLALTVEAGVYYIVSWANNIFSDSSDHFSYGEGNSFYETYIYHIQNTESAAPLHYAPDVRDLVSGIDSEDIPGIYRIYVAEDMTTEYTLSFMSAHRTINIYLKDFPEIGSALPNPSVSLSGFSSYYNCLLWRGDETAIFTQTATERVKENELFGYNSFYVPHFDRKNLAMLTITSADHSYEFICPLTDILDELQIDILTDGDNLTIEFVVSYRSEGEYVEIEVPSWDIIGVSPF